MNINVLIDQLKKRIGLNGILAGIYNDTMLKDIILNDSLVTFSRYNSFYIQTCVDTIFNNWPTKRLSTKDGIDMEVLVPDDIMEHLKSLGSEIVGARISKRMVYPINGMIYSRGFKDDLLFMQAGQVIRANNVDPSVLWRSPNTIILKNFALGYSFAPLAYSVKLRVTHPRNLSTITKGMEDIFTDLCYADIILNIYNNDLKMMSVQTGSSQVDLNTEPFSSASSIRDEVISRIKKKAAIDNMILEF